MAYEVTATRRRPQLFEDLVGQDFVASTLKNAIRSGQIAHAYLFAGPRGCGKTTSARIMAKALNCMHGDVPSATPCGVCPACAEITKGSSIDVIEIDGASNTSVNDVRQIKDEVLFPPHSCRYKIYIIDEVHMLSTSAFNALLKTIEEPPPYVIFIFATTELHKVPATIKSRCQQFNFRLVAVEQIKAQLAAAAAEVSIQADDEALYWIAWQATGSMRDAYTLFDQVASFSEGSITFDKIRTKLGLVAGDQLNEIAEKCCAGDAAAALTALDTIFEGGVSVEQYITDMAGYFRSLLFIKAGITKEALLGQAAERFSRVVLDTWTAGALEHGLSLLLNLYRDIRYSLNPRYEVDLTVSRLATLSLWVSPADVHTAITDARSLLLDGRAAGQRSGGMLKAQFAPVNAGNGASASSAVMSPPVYAAAPVTPPPVVPSAPPATLAELKAAALATLQNSNAMTAASLSQTGDWTEANGVISVTAGSEFVARQIAKDTASLSALLTKLWTHAVHLEVSVQSDKTTEGQVQKTIPPQAEALLNVFKGSIVEE